MRTIKKNFIITIYDNGVGFKESGKDNEQDPYFTTKKDGSGLGLSIVTNIINKHHSQTNLISEIGVGTTFWFDLALYQDNCPSLESSKNTNILSRTVNIYPI